jgi:very-short-patch-repair endonuclease
MKRLALKPGTVERARKLRREMTPQERMLWHGLKEAFPSVHFRKQVPLGLYYADFACHAAKLVIEIDGGQHADAIAYDAARTAFLESEGYIVIRFWNNDVTTNLDGVLTAISEFLPPRGGG